MSDISATHADLKQGLSALVDGELDAPAVQRICSAWREDVSVRSTWHAYQVIGDVLRSDDLACAPARDEAFLAGLRARLAQEPVVLAPATVRAGAVEAPASVAQTTRRRTWAAPMAVAAGFMAVAGVLVVSRVAAPLGSPATSSFASWSPAPVQASVQADAPIEVNAAFAPDLKLIRDVRLDRYLAAHKQFDRAGTVSVPGVMLRNAAAVAPDR